MWDPFLCFLFADWYRGYLIKHKMLQVRLICSYAGPSRVSSRAVPQHTGPLNSCALCFPTSAPCCLPGLSPLFHSFFKADLQGSLLLNLFLRCQGSPLSPPSPEPLGAVHFYLQCILYCLPSEWLGHSPFPHLRPQHDRERTGPVSALGESPVPTLPWAIVPTSAGTCFAHPPNSHGIEHNSCMSPVCLFIEFREEFPSNW